jgi:hypothetical protein
MSKYRESLTKMTPSGEAAVGLETPATTARHPESNRRRKLLKVAASAGPLIATLPSGEALANASALQCVINEQDDTTPPAQAVVSDPPPEGDLYLRVEGEVRLYRSLVSVEDGGAGIGNLLVYSYQLDGDDILVVGDNPNNATAAPLGAWFDLDVLPAPLLLSTTPARFLYLYGTEKTPIENPGDVNVNPDTGMPTEDCFITGPAWPGDPTSPTGPTSPQHCVYPMAVQVLPNGSRTNNIPLTHSCLTSFPNG